MFKRSGWKPSLSLTCKCFRIYTKEQHKKVKWEARVTGFVILNKYKSERCGLRRTPTSKCKNTWGRQENDLYRYNGRVSKLKWPSQSSDLISFQNLWKDLRKAFPKCFFHFFWLSLTYLLRRMKRKKKKKSWLQMYKGGKGVVQKNPFSCNYTRLLMHIWAQRGWIWIHAMLLQFFSLIKKLRFISGFSKILFWCKRRTVTNTKMQLCRMFSSRWTLLIPDCKTNFTISHWNCIR